MSAPTLQTTKNALRERMARLGVDPDDVEERFARSSGPGGQHVNKTSTSVALRHTPTGIAVRVEETRSQARNRQLAWERLLDAIQAGREAARAEKKSAREKKRRQNAKRPRGVKERILEGKRRRSQTKKLRGPV